MTTTTGRECITHHDACDCREEKIKRLVEAAEELDNYLGFLPEWCKIEVVKFREALEGLK